MTGKSRTTDASRSRQPRRYNYLRRRNADEVPWNHLSAEERTQFSKAIETEWQGVLDFKVWTAINPSQADANREKQRYRVILFRLVLRWKETDTGCKAKARWYLHCETKCICVYGW